VPNSLPQDSGYIRSVCIGILNELSRLVSTQIHLIANS